MNYQLCPMCRHNRCRTLSLAPFEHLSVSNQDVKSRTLREYRAPFVNLFVYASRGEARESEDGSVWACRVLSRWSEEGPVLRSFSEAGSVAN